MTRLTRRECLAGLGLAGGALPLAGAIRDARAGTNGPTRAQGTPTPQPLDITGFQPRSMLHVPATRVERARFPVIDVHTHLGFAGREGMRFAAPPGALLPVMDRKNVRTMVNTTGGSGKDLDESLARFDRQAPGRFVTFTEPRWDGLNVPGWGREQADALARAREAGARGLKVLKTLGLGLRENGRTGALIKVDDPRLDPMWDACGSLRMPVLIHVADPEAFFLPIDRFNERFEELNNHPDWSFHGGDFPSFRELVDAFDRIVARHPRTQFIAAHFGLNAENLPSVSERMDRYANLHVDTAARIGELGRQPRLARRVFERHQDRILFGTDAVPDGHDTPQQVFGDALYEIYFRCLETEDEYFDYAPAPVPPQGRWAIYGLGLPEGILRKVYHDNAARLLGL